MCLNSRVSNLFLIHNLSFWFFTFHWKKNRVLERMCELKNVLVYWIETFTKLNDRINYVIWRWINFLWKILKRTFFEIILQNELSLRYPKMIFLWDTPKRTFFEISQNPPFSLRYLKIIFLWNIPKRTFFEISQNQHFSFGLNT